MLAAQAADGILPRGVLSRTRVPESAVLAREGNAQQGINRHEHKVLEIRKAGRRMRQRRRATCLLQGSEGGGIVVGAWAWLARS